MLSIKYTKSYLASFLKIWSKKLRWKYTGCRLLRSSHQRCSVKKPVLKNFAIFTVLESLFIKAAGLACNLRLLLTPLEKMLVIITTTSFNNATATYNPGHNILELYKVLVQV